MMTELMLVEGVSDVQLISYYLQNVYMWQHEKSNDLGIAPMDKQDHIESLSKDGNQLVLCGVGGNGKFAHFVEQHRINSINSVIIGAPQIQMLFYYRTHIYQLHFSQLHCFPYHHLNKLSLK